jgi:hypothetical protein
MRLKTRRGSSETKEDLKELRGNQCSPPPTGTSAAPFGLVPGPTPIAAACHEVFGSNSAEEGKLRLAEALKAEDLVKG